MTVSQRFPMPIEVRVPDNSQINPNSEAFSFDMLVPGVKVPLMATAGCRQLRQDQKIDKMDVRQDEAGEVVTLTLIPFPGAKASTVGSEMDYEEHDAPIQQQMSV